MEAPIERSGYASGVLSGPICAMLNLDWLAVAERAGIPASDASVPGFRVSAEEYVRLWGAIVELAKTPNVPLLLGQRLASGPAVPVLLALSTAPDFETGLTRLSRYKHVFGPISFAVSRTPTVFSIGVVSHEPDVSLPGSFTAPQIIYLHAKANAMSTRRFLPTRVTLPLPEHERKELADIFGVLPGEGAPLLEYASQDVRIPFVSPNAELWRMTEVDLRAQANMMSREVSLSSRVRAALLEAFATSDPTLSHVCGCLRLSKSTLLRRLRGEGTTFQLLREQTRRDLALRYLEASDLSNQQIAHLLGYRDTSAFQRAFRKWTGKSPRRAQADFNAPPPGSRQDRYDTFLANSTGEQS